MILFVDRGLSGGVVVVLQTIPSGLTLDTMYAN